MKIVLPFLSLLASTILAQEDRCDVPYPNTYCNTTTITAFQSASCTPYHIFIARGSDEPYPGRLGNITSQICSNFGKNTCTFENIIYPAKSTAWGKDEWCKSAGKGAIAGQKQMREYSTKCPDSRLVLLGFSQGAAVAQDILGGGGGKVFECEQDVNPPLDPSVAPGSNVVAAVTFGAVVRSRNQNFTFGDGINFDGRRARTPSQIVYLQKYNSVFREYCHYGDPMCAVGSEPANVWVHLDYFLGHNEEVIPWVVQKAKSSRGTAIDPASHTNETDRADSSQVPQASVKSAGTCLANAPNASVMSLLAMMIYTMLL